MHYKPSAPQSVYIQVWYFLNRVLSFLYNVFSVPTFIWKITNQYHRPFYSQGSSIACSTNGSKIGGEQTNRSIREHNYERSIVSRPFSSYRKKNLREDDDDVAPFSVFGDWKYLVLRFCTYFVAFCNTNSEFFTPSPSEIFRTEILGTSVT